MKNFIIELKKHIFSTFLNKKVSKNNDANILKEQIEHIFENADTKTGTKKFIELKIFVDDKETIKEELYNFSNTNEIPVYFYNTPELFLSRKENPKEGIIAIATNKNNPYINFTVHEINQLKGDFISIFLTNANDTTKLDFVEDEIYFNPADNFEIVEIAKEMGLTHDMAPTFSYVAKALMGFSRIQIKEIIYDIYFIKKLKNLNEILSIINNLKEKLFETHYEYLSYSFNIESQTKLYNYSYLFDYVSSNFYSSKRSNVLITGSEGSQKSLFAYDSAAKLKLPLLKINFNTLVNNKDSELKLKNIIELIDFFSPCFVLIEDYDKYLSENIINLYGKELFKPLFYNIFQNWINNNDSKIIVVATAKDSQLTAKDKEPFRKICFPDRTKSSVFLPIIWTYIINNKLNFDFNTIKNISESIPKEIDIDDLEKNLDIFNRYNKQEEIITQLNFQLI